MARPLPDQRGGDGATLYIKAAEVARLMVSGPSLEAGVCQPISDLNQAEGSQ